MPFEPGQSGNLAGRPKGSLNKRHEKIYEAYTAIFEENTDKLKEELQKLSGKDFCTIMMQMADYILPKRSRVSVSKESDAPEQVFMIDDLIISFN